MVSNGCSEIMLLQWLCRRMWMLLQVHAKQCQRSDCPVPRCKELREMRRRAVVRQEDQRRVAYKNMVRAWPIDYIVGVNACIVLSFTAWQAFVSVPGLSSSSGAFMTVQASE